MAKGSAYARWAASLGAPPGGALAAPSVQDALARLSLACPGHLRPPVGPDADALAALLARTAARPRPPVVVLVGDDGPDLPRTQRLAVDAWGTVLVRPGADGAEGAEGATVLGPPELLAGLDLPRLPGAPPERPGTDRALVVLDVDGVLIEPGRSFREAVAGALAELAPGLAWGDGPYAAVKRLGGFNNDFRLTAGALALAEAGLALEGPALAGALTGLEARVQALEPRCTEAVRRHYAGTRRLERPLVGREDLAELPLLAIFTGRPPAELAMAFQVLGFTLPAVGDSADHLRKPRPEGLLQLADAFRATRVLFVGDTIDDAATLAGARALRPELSWTFAAVGPDRDTIGCGEGLRAPRLKDLLPQLVTWSRP